jgi:predicted transcriptional regulator
MENPIIIPNISNTSIKELSTVIYQLKLEVLRQIAEKTGKDLEELKSKYLPEED